MEADLEGNNKNIKETDEHKEEIDEDEELEGEEELASESDDDDGGSNSGCDIDDLGYASF